MQLLVLLLFFVLFVVLIIRAKDRSADSADHAGSKSIERSQSGLDDSFPLSSEDHSVPEKSVNNVSYDFERWRNCYWLCPEFSGDGEAFKVMPEWLSSFFERDSIFQFLSDEVVMKAIVNKAYFLSTTFWLDEFMQEYESDYKNHESANLYLVKGERMGQEFFKIGLTLQQDPIKRDKKVYKEVFSCRNVKAGTRLVMDSQPELYEKYSLWKCCQSDQIIHIQMDPKKFKGWAGRSEIVQTVDDSIKNIFNESCNELEKGLSIYRPVEIYAELSMLCLAIKACWDEEHLYSGHAVADSLFPVWSVAGSKPSKSIPELYIGLKPDEVRRAERFMVQKLAPFVERAWDICDIRDRKTRYNLSIQKSNEYYSKIRGPHGRKWGVNNPKYDRNYGEDQYLNLIDYKENIGKSYL